jgi:hypothetical protein
MRQLAFAEIAIKDSRRQADKTDGEIKQLDIKVG